MATATVTLKDYQAGLTAWCPGCGNFGILTAVKRALVELGKAPQEMLFVSGIGQAGKKIAAGGGLRFDERQLAQHRKDDFSTKHCGGRYDGRPGRPGR